MYLDKSVDATPSVKKFILKSFFKDDKCVISPAKDGNGRYKGIRENISEVEKLKTGYTPSVESRIKLYDGIEIDLTDDSWSKDWEWMKYCQEIADSFADGQVTPGAYFYIYKPGVESAKKVNSEKLRYKLIGHILGDTPDDLYNRVKVLGNDMSTSTISDVQEFLLGLVDTAPESINRVYENEVYKLEIMFLKAVEEHVIVKRGGSYVFGDIFLGVDRRGVISYLGNPKNSVTVMTIEAATYGKRPASLADELVETHIDDAKDLEEIENSPKEPGSARSRAAAAKKDKK